MWPSPKPNSESQPHLELSALANRTPRRCFFRILWNHGLLVLLPDPKVEKRERAFFGLDPFQRGPPSVGPACTSCFTSCFNSCLASSLTSGFSSCTPSWRRRERRFLHLADHLTRRIAVGRFRNPQTGQITNNCGWTARDEPVFVGFHPSSIRNEFCPCKVGDWHGCSLLHTPDSQIGRPRSHSLCPLFPGLLG